MADERLLRTVVEQLKLPMLQIARSAELAEQSGDVEALSSIRVISESTLKLIDGFLLSLNQGSLQLEPVSISSVLQDAMYTLTPLAAKHDCDIELSIAGKYGPVMAHRESLQSAIELLGSGLIESRPTEKKRHRVLLAAHKTAQGLVTGVFDNQSGLSTNVFRRGKALYGTARQPMPTVSAASGAGFFVADTIFSAMETPLRVAKHQRFTGLAATLHQSSQLRLVS